MIAGLFLIAFILGIDQFSFSRILYRPLLACTLLGLILGDITKGVILGAVLEMLLVSYQSSRDGMTAETGGFLLLSIVSTIFVIQSGMETSAAVGAASALTTLGVYINYLIKDLNIVFLPSARKAAETGNEKKLALSNFIPMMVTGLIYGALASASYVLGEGAADTLSLIITNAGWVLNGLAIAGILMPCIGFAVLMRNIGYQDRKAVFYLGGAAGALMIMLSSGNTGLLLCAIAAVAIAAYEIRASKNNDNTSNTSSNTNAEKTTEIKGGAEKWW